MWSFRSFFVLFLFLAIHDNNNNNNIIVSGTELKFDGDEMLSHIVTPLPYTYLDPSKLPQNFFWGNVGGRSYLTHMLNQHIPQCKTERRRRRRIKAPKNMDS
jgi:hypothetical protein